MYAEVVGMATLTKKQTKALQTILYHLNRADKYLMSPTTAIGRLGSPATTSLHFTRPDGVTFYKMDKEIGSDLTGLRDAMKLLQQFIAGPTVEQE